MSACLNEIRSMGLSFAFVWIATIAQAQSFPSQSVQLIVPFPAASNPDVVARILAPPLSDAWKQTVIVDNRPGAGGMIAGTAVARAVPDGHTLLVGTSGSIVIAPLIVPKPQWRWNQTFVPVSSIGVTPVVLHVRPGLPVKSVGELVAYAKQNPGKLTVADGGLGAINHLAGELMRLSAKVDWLRVQYTGVPRAIQDVLGGSIDVLFAQVSTTLSLIQSGSLRALATMGESRLQALPDLPTMEEVGFKGLVAEGFVGLFAPIQTPKNIVMQLGVATEAALHESKIVTALDTAGVTIRNSSSDAFTRYVQEETDKWERVIVEGKLKFE
jgi:tripartite-type tricarboxylate transporter receptor subunit TctC